MLTFLKEIVASGTIDPVYRISEPKASTELPLLVLWDNQTSNQIRAPVYLVPTNYSVLCRNLNPSGMERPLRVSLKKRWSWTPERQALFEQSFKEVKHFTIIMHPYSGRYPKKQTKSLLLSRSS